MSSLDARVAELASRFVEHVWPKLERRGGVLDLPPMNRKAKGESSPAIGEHGLEVVMANIVASKYLRSFLDDFEISERRAKNGVHFSDVLAWIRYDPGCITNWRAGKTSEDKRMMAAFDEVMNQVARGCIFVAGERSVKEALDKGPDDPERFTVRVRPIDEQQRQKTREAQVRDTAHTDRVIVRRIESLEACGLGREEAKRALSSDKDNTWSYWRIDRAIVSTNRRERGEVA